MVLPIHAVWVAAGHRAVGFVATKAIRHRGLECVRERLVGCSARRSVAIGPDACRSADVCRDNGPDKLSIDRLCSGRSSATKFTEPSTGCLSHRVLPLYIGGRSVFAFGSIIR